MLFSLTQDHMEEIVLYAAEQSFPGPPSSLYSLMLTCRAFYSSLNPSTNPRLYVRLFNQMFDGLALARRLPPSSSLPEYLATELKRRCLAMKCFRRHDARDSGLSTAFLVAYLMLLEDDGKNSEQLRWSGLPEFVIDYLYQHLHEDIEEHGWPSDSEANSLAVALLWQLTDQNMISCEDEERRRHIMTLLMPYALVGFRYPLLAARPSNSSLVAGSNRGCKAMDIAYFGQQNRIRLPSVTLHAILSCLVRLEKRPFQIPDHLPRTRVEADLRGIRGVTREDIEEYNTQCRTSLIPPPSSEKSKAHDADWARAISASAITGEEEAPPRPYKLGSLTGKWQGTYLARAILHIARKSHSLMHFFAATTPRNQFIVTKWTFSNFSHEEPRIDVQSSYGPDTTSTGINSTTPFDVILTGSCEARHAAAWGAYKFFGRVRTSDGLIILHRQPSADEPDCNRNAALFVGYVLSSQNLVGRMQNLNASQETDNEQWQGIWCLSKK
ncbi:hypothetical protein EW146_g1949 [Bondarzewia mesenterica]|uniref:Uncharacterized protein n=1 Tax=Bondarzewia mesenterica TaxID=1095465 RepID=A0A4S4M2C5_9AGAM|nr:hypothetical protein EW146_g1949 [Bondarzewia mesenterica]